MRNLIITTGAGVALTVALLLKWNHASTESAISLTPLSAEQAAQLGMEPSGQKALAPGSPYQLYSYRDRQCRGAIAVTPLYRNSEAAQLLKNTLRNRQVRFGYLFEGQLRTTFPERAFVQQQLWHRVTRLFQQRPLPLTLAWAEIGHCNLAQRLEQFAQCDAELDHPAKCHTKNLAGAPDTP